MVERAAHPLRLVFCGTPQFAVPTLEAVLAAGHSVELVMTQPDRPAGRGMQVAASPVKQAAFAAGLHVEQPEKIRNNQPLRDELERIAPDAILVVAYGRIIPPWMLTLPRFGNINLHGSLLPKYRGAAPIQWAVAQGEPVTGVTTMLLEEGLDTGPMLLRTELPIGENETAADLFSTLAELGAPLMLKTLEGLAAGTLPATPQDESQATLAPILTRDDGRVDWSRSAAVVYNRWRGFQPWPGAWSTLAGKKFTVTRMAWPADAPRSDDPGILHIENTRLFVACGDGASVECIEVQLEGKRAMPAADFLRGQQNLEGAHLG